MQLPIAVVTLQYLSQALLAVLLLPMLELQLVFALVVSDASLLELLAVV